jgi:hypothetical protein
MKKFRDVLQNSEVPAIFGIYEIILHKKNPYNMSTALVDPHESTDFIKCRLLATGSMARIKPSEYVSRLLILVVHHRSDG